jgi:hypothetical protein
MIFDKMVKESMTEVEKNVNNEEMGQCEGPFQGPMVEIQGLLFID